MDDTHAAAHPAPPAGRHHWQRDVLELISRRGLVEGGQSEEELEKPKLRVTPGVAAAGGRRFGMQSVTEGDLFSFGWVTEAEKKESSPHIHIEGGGGAE